MWTFVWAHSQRFKTRETSCPDLSTSCDTSSKTWVNYWTRRSGWQPSWPRRKREDRWSFHLNDWPNVAAGILNPIWTSSLKSSWICEAVSHSITRHKSATHQCCRVKLVSYMTSQILIHFIFTSIFTCLWAITEEEQQGFVSTGQVILMVRVSLCSAYNKNLSAKWTKCGSDGWWIWSENHHRKEMK